MHGLSEADPRRSQLTFVTSRESAESLDFAHLKRAREPVGRSKSGVQGKIADVFCGGSRHAESQNELRGFRILLATGRTDNWQEQPFRLQYHHDGAKHRYTPDILVAWGTYREVVEIKEDAEAGLLENQKRFALIRELLAEHNYQFRVWRRSEICAEPRLTNVGFLLRYRCHRRQRNHTVDRLASAAIGEVLNHARDLVSERNRDFSATILNIRRTRLGLRATPYTGK